MIKIKAIIFVLLFSIFLCSIIPAKTLSESDLRKLDPLLRSALLRNSISQLAPTRNQQMQTTSEPLLNTIIKIDSNPAIIKSTGAIVRSITGNILTADVPLSSLDNLIALPNVVYIQSARKMQISREMQPALDVSVPETGADQVWVSSPAYTGKGVIVGVIDTGIDWNHPSFLGKDGKSRILYIWDQSIHTPDKYPKGYNYGTEWTKDDIDAGICGEIDEEGHGTHVTSIVAGDERSINGFTGVAPEADIIAVKTSFSDADIIDAATYIFQKADELKKPAVLNMSFGSQWGPHDGTELSDQALDFLISKSGQAITASAGNDGSKSIHVGVTSLRSPEGNNYPWVAIRPLIGAQFLPIQVWYDPADTISVRLLLPINLNGDLGDLGIGWVTKGNSLSFNIAKGPLKGAEIVIDTSYLASSDLYPNFNQIYIHIYNNDDPSIPIDDYIYGIEFDGSRASFDAYTPYYGLFTSKLPVSISTPSKSFLIFGDGYKTVISPSSASRIISVGSYVTKSEWIDSENRIRNDNLNIDKISAFSSLGPLLNGKLKPDISAPGEMIVAGFSSDAWSHPRYLYRDEAHAPYRGTSMSSPHVAGAIALMLQQNPKMDIQAITDRLIFTATDQGESGWDRVWGYGKLNVLSAMNIPSTPRNIEAILSDNSVTIKWSANPESNVTGYRLYLQSKSIDVGNVTSYKLDNLPNGIPVSFSLSAYNISGNESAKTYVTTTVPGEPNATPPERPKGITLMPINTALDVKWSRNTEYDIDGYHVYYGLTPNKYDKVVTVNNSTSYRIESLTNGVGIFVAVSAFDKSGNESAKSDEFYAVPELFPLSELRYQNGWPLRMDHDIQSSPAIYDVDNDGKMEIAITTRSGRVALLRYNGVYASGWPITMDTGSVSSPAISDIDGDGKVEIIATAGGVISAWHYNSRLVSGWPQNAEGNFVASPAVGDIDDDGKMEIVIGSLDGKVYAFESDSSSVKGWPIALNDPIHSTAAIADIDGDSKKEIVVCSYNGIVCAFKGDGTRIKGFPVNTYGNILSSPVLGDINGDGEVEIVVTDTEGMVNVWHQDGSEISGFPVNLKDPILASPVLGDMDNNASSLEIVICTRGGKVFVIKSNGSVMSGFPVPISGTVTSSPSLCDINGDGSSEVIIGGSTDQGYTGMMYALDRFGKKANLKFPFGVDGNIINSTPALADIDGNGSVELVVGTNRFYDGTGGQLHVWELPGNPGKNGYQWSQFQHDPSHTGYYEDIISPSLIIMPIQESLLDKHLVIYIISSEKLRSLSSLKVDIGGIVTSINLEQISNRIYKADFLAENSGQYTFSVSGMDMSGNTGNSSKSVSIKVEREYKGKYHFALYQNYPNPFNPGTWIPYELEKAESVTISIYSSDGKLVRTLNLGLKPAGIYTGNKDSAYWDGKDNDSQDSSSGIYFCVFKAGNFRTVSKMLLLK
jgi:minor extracellular serine protease Vpr